MTPRMFRMTSLLVLPVVGCLLLGNVQSYGQEKKSESKASSAKKVSDEKKAPAEKKTRSKPRGRLPAYFSSVVSEKQREDIYKIQSNYQEELDKLIAQVVELKSERDKAVEEVLSEEQLEEVQKLRDEARARLKKKISDSTSKKATDSSASKSRDN